MKICSRCFLEKPESEYAKKNQGTQSWCKACQRIYAKEHYAKNVPKYKAKAKESKKRLVEWARSLKDGKPCTDCGGVFHYEAMHWDHTSIDKEENVAILVQKQVSRKRILAEIEKCELVCANCHALRTYTRRIEAV